MKILHLAKIRVPLLLAVTLIITGCGKSEKTEPATEPAAVSAKADSKTATISKWKTSSGKTAMGLVLEQMGDAINANLFELKGTNGFVTGDKLAVGNYQPAQKAVVLMMGNLSVKLMSVEEWVANGGPYVKIPYEPGATNLTMTTVIPSGPKVNVDLVPYN